MSFRQQCVTVSPVVKSRVNVMDVDGKALYSGVGKALRGFMQAVHSIQVLPEFIKARDLHLRQHQLVQKIILIKESKGCMTFNMLREKDDLLDTFVTITNDLDAALDRLNHSASRVVFLAA